MVQMARLRKVTKSKEKPELEKHGSLVRVEINDKHKYLTIIAQDGFVITVIDADYDKVKDAFKQARKQKRNEKET